MLILGIVIKQVPRSWQHELGFEKHFTNHLLSRAACLLTRCSSRRHLTTLCLQHRSQVSSTNEIRIKGHAPSSAIFPCWWLNRRQFWHPCHYRLCVQEHTSHSICHAEFVPIWAGFHFRLPISANQKAQQPNGISLCWIWPLWFSAAPSF